MRFHVFKKANADFLSKTMSPLAIFQKLCYTAIMVKPLAKLLLALNSNVRASQIAAGFAWGVLLGLIPAANFFWLLMFIVSFFFLHNHAGKLFVAAIIKIFINSINPLLDAGGWEFLHIESLQNIFTILYNTPFVPFTKFNNTLVAGGMLCGLALFIPMYIILRLLVPLYRKTLLPKIIKNKFVITVQNLPFVKKLMGAYNTLQSFKDADIVGGL